MVFSRSHIKISMFTVPEKIKSSRTFKEMTWKTFTSIKRVEDSDSVSICIRPPLLALRCFGAYPFSTKRTAEGNCLYYWKLFSWPSLYSILVTVIWVYFLCLWYTEYVPLVLLSNNRAWIGGSKYNSSSIERFAMKMFPLANPTLSAFLLLSALSHGRNLLELINNWSQFEKEYKKVFPLSDKPFKPLGRFRNRGLVVGLIILVSFIYIGNHLQDLHCDFSEEKEETTRNINENLCRGVTRYILISAVIGFFEDSKQILLLHACRIAFEQVRVSVSMLGTSLFISRKIPTDNVRKWTSLLIFIREQVKLTGKVLSVYNLCNILTIFVILCSSIFVLLNNLVTVGEGNPKIKQASIVSLSLCWVGFTRLSVKAIVAENMMNEEKKFANEVRLIKEAGTGQDLMTRLEMSILINLIERKPVVIRFGGVMTLDFSLLLQIVGQVATYLIVLVQFNNMEK